MYKWYEQFCSARQATGKYRILPEVPAIQGREWLDFSTNDYLALARSPELAAGALAALAEGAGSTGSRLLSGNSERLMALERRIAADKGTAAALIFNSGFQANCSVLASLTDENVIGQKALVFFDRLNHASLYQGVFASGAQLVRYPHCDINRLAALLDKFRANPAPKFIITETVFGMDGDTAPVSEIAQLAAEHHAFLYLDEAHATGVCGAEGYGLSSEMDLCHTPYLAMGTFSKALGCSGAYVACDELVKNFLVNHCPGFIYSTAPSPMLVGAMCAAWEWPRNHPAKRRALQVLAELLRAGLRDLGLDTGLSETHIVPVILGGETETIAAKARLLQDRIVVSAVRPPTVPPGTSRLRIALTTTHTEADVVRLLSVMKEIS